MSPKAIFLRSYNTKASIVKQSQNHQSYLIFLFARGRIENEYCVVLCMYVLRKRHKKLFYVMLFAQRHLPSRHFHLHFRIYKCLK